MKLNTEQLEIVEQMAACNYTIKKIALYLGVNAKLLKSEWRNQNSEVRYHYDRGQLKSEFEIAQKRLLNATNGNLTADQQHQKEKEKRKLENVKEEILFSSFIDLNEYESEEPKKINT